MDDGLRIARQIDGPNEGADFMPDKGIARDVQSPHSDTLRKYHLTCFKVRHSGILESASYIRSMNRHHIAAIDRNNTAAAHWEAGANRQAADRRKAFAGRAVEKANFGIVRFSHLRTVRRPPHPAVDVKDRR